MATARHREELAWAAGFFDGEGHVGTGRPTSKRLDLYLSISQVERRVLDRFRAAVGCGKVDGPYLHPVSVKRGNEQPRYYFQTQRFEYVQAIITMLWTFLSPVKREQALRALMAASDRANHHQTCRNGHPRTADNLRMVGPSRSWRACRACQRDKEQAYRERKLASVLLEAT